MRAPYWRRAMGMTLAVIGTVLLASVLFIMVWLSMKVWLLLFAGILFAVFLRWWSEWISENLGLNIGIALALVIIFLLGGCSLGGWLIVPAAIEQFQELSKKLPEAIQEVHVSAQRFGLGQYWRNMTLTSAIAKDTGTMVTKFSGFFTSGAEMITGLLLILFLGLYFAMSPETYIQGLLQLLPRRSQKRVREVLTCIGKSMRSWLFGQIISMTVVGVLIGFGLKLLGVPLPVALGFLAALFDFIPIVGPLISAVPAVLFGFLISPLHALYVVLLFLFVNAVIESHILVPLVQRYTVAIPPALTVFAMVLMGVLFGFLGVLLATPIVATLIVIIRMFYIEDILGTRAPDSG